MVTDERLMLDVKGGSREAFETLFQRHRDAVWRFFRRRVPEGRAEDLVQDVFLALFRGSTRYEPRASFRSYLFGIAYNVLLAERRKLDRESANALDDPPAASLDPEAVLWVRRAIATLDGDARDIVMLREYEQLSYQELADLLHIPINTVRSRLFRARMDLKAALLQQREAPRTVARNFGSAPASVSAKAHHEHS